MRSRRSARHNSPEKTISHLLLKGGSANQMKAFYVSKILEVYLESKSMISPKKRNYKTNAYAFEIVSDFLSKHNLNITLTSLRNENPFTQNSNSAKTMKDTASFLQFRDGSNILRNLIEFRKRQFSDKRRKKNDKKENIQNNEKSDASLKFRNRRRLRSSKNNSNSENSEDNAPVPQKTGFNQIVNLSNRRRNQKTLQAQNKRPKKSARRGRSRSPSVKSNSNILKNENDNNIKSIQTARRSKSASSHNQKPKQQVRFLLDTIPDTLKKDNVQKDTQIKSIIKNPIEPKNIKKETFQDIQKNRTAKERKSNISKGNMIDAESQNDPPLIRHFAFKKSKGTSARSLTNFSIEKLPDLVIGKENIPSKKALLPSDDDRPKYSYNNNDILVINNPYDDNEILSYNYSESDTDLNSPLKEKIVHMSIDDDNIDDDDEPSFHYKNHPTNEGLSIEKNVEAQHIQRDSPLQISKPFETFQSPQSPNSLEHCIIMSIENRGAPTQNNKNHRNSKQNDASPEHKVKNFIIASDSSAVERVSKNNKSRKSSSRNSDRKANKPDEKSSSKSHNHPKLPPQENKKYTKDRRSKSLNKVKSVSQFDGNPEHPDNLSDIQININKSRKKKENVDSDLEKIMQSPPNEQVNSSEIHKFDINVVKNSVETSPLAEGKHNRSSSINASPDSENSIGLESNDSSSGHKTRSSKKNAKKESSKAEQKNNNSLINKDPNQDNAHKNKSKKSGRNETKSRSTKDKTKDGKKESRKHERSESVPRHSRSHSQKSTKEKNEKRTETVKDRKKKIKDYKNADENSDKKHNKKSKRSESVSLKKKPTNMNNSNKNIKTNTRNNHKRHHHSYSESYDYDSLYYSDDYQYDDYESDHHYHKRHSGKRNQRAQKDKIRHDHKSNDRNTSSDKNKNYSRSPESLKSDKRSKKHNTSNLSSKELRSNSVPRKRNQSALEQLGKSSNRKTKENVSKQIKTSPESNHDASSEKRKRLNSSTEKTKTNSKIDIRRESSDSRSRASISSNGQNNENISQQGNVIVNKDAKVEKSSAKVQIERLKRSQSVPRGGSSISQSSDSKTASKSGSSISLSINCEEMSKGKQQHINESYEKVRKLQYENSPEGRKRSILESSSTSSKKGLTSDVNNRKNSSPTTNAQNIEMKNDNQDNNNEEMFASLGKKNKNVSQKKFDKNTQSNENKDKIQKSKIHLKNERELSPSKENSSKKDNASIIKMEEAISKKNKSSEKDEESGVITILKPDSSILQSGNNNNIKQNIDTNNRKNSNKPSNLTNEHILESHIKPFFNSKENFSESSSKNRANTKNSQRNETQFSNKTAEMKVSSISKGTTDGNKHNNNILLTEQITKNNNSITKSKYDEINPNNNSLANSDLKKDKRDDQNQKNQNITYQEKSKTGGTDSNLQLNGFSSSKGSKLQNSRLIDNEDDNFSSKQFTSFDLSQNSQQLFSVKEDSKLCDKQESSLSNCRSNPNTKNENTVSFAANTILNPNLNSSLKFDTNSELLHSPEINPDFSSIASENATNPETNKKNNVGKVILSDSLISYKQLHNIEDENSIKRDIKPIIKKDVSNSKKVSSTSENILSHGSKTTKSNENEEGFVIKVLQVKKLPQKNESKIFCRINVGKDIANFDTDAKTGNAPLFTNSFSFFAKSSDVVLINVINQSNSNIISSLKARLSQFTLGLEKWYRMKPSGLIHLILQPPSIFPNPLDNQLAFNNNNKNTNALNKKKQSINPSEDESTDKSNNENFEYDDVNLENLSEGDNVDIAYNDSANEELMEACIMKQESRDRNRWRPSNSSNGDSNSVRTATSGMSEVSGIDENAINISGIDFQTSSSHKNNSPLF